MRTLLVLALAAFFTLPQQQVQRPTPDDYRIVSDEVKNGVRTIVAIPSPMVCSKRIDIKIDAKTNVIQSCVFTRGCNGNLKAVNVLLQGMTVRDAVKKLDGIDCAGRGTSCTDQLARVLKKCYNLP